MIQRRHPKGATPLGYAVPNFGAPAAPRDAYCERCGARLSRYNHWTATLCAPCDAATNPWEPPTRKGRDTCPGCGGLKKLDSRRCRRCADKGVRIDFTGHTPL